MTRVLLMLSFFGTKYSNITLLIFVTLGFRYGQGFIFRLFVIVCNGL